MRVVLAYTMLVPEVTRALDASEVDWEGVDVSDSDEAYWELLDDLWNYGQDFAIIEHDIVVSPGTLKSFEECPEPWCAARYPYLRGFYAGLGCVRFRSSMMQAAPHLMDEVALLHNATHAPKHYCTLDAWIQRQAREHGLGTACLDHGKVDHLGDQWPRHGCHGPKP